MATLEQTNGTLTIDGVKVTDKLSQFYANSPLGAMDTAIGNTFYGLNHRLMPSALPINKDHYGLTFFTRPMMNMSSENLRNIRQMTPLLTQNNQSLPRIIRMLLDSRLKQGEQMTCPFVDNQQAFIPILTETLVSVSGWPDMEVPTFTSPEGNYKEVYSFVDGLSLNYSAYNISATFRNVLGDPITMMFFWWLHYMSFVYQGELVPYPDFIIRNTLDYNTRIWRLVLDADRNIVQKIGCCGAAFPTGVTLGASFNFESNQPLNGPNDQITVPFQCVGAIYQDPILIYEFNKVVMMFNGAMKDGVREKYYTKIPRDLLILFNHKGYPRIDTDTYELQWWIDADEYKRVLSLK